MKRNSKLLRMHVNKVKKINKFFLKGEVETDQTTKVYFKGK